MKKFTLLITGLFLVLSLSAQVYDQLFLVGDGTDVGWDQGSAIELTKTDEGVFTWTGTLYENSDEKRFKFLVQREDWHPSITCRLDVDGHLVVEPGNEYDLYERANADQGYDNAFQVAETGVYTINVDLNTMTMTITDDQGTGINESYNETVPYTLTSLNGKIKFITADNFKADQFEIYNMAGSLIDAASNISTNFVTDSQLKCGIYVVKVRSNGKTYASKVLVK
jgi:hypothetical protein